MPHKNHTPLFKTASPLCTTKWPSPISKNIWVSECVHKTLQPGEEHQPGNVVIALMEVIEAPHYGQFDAILQNSSELRLLMEKTGRSLRHASRRYWSEARENSISLPAKSGLHKMQSEHYLSNVPSGYTEWIKMRDQDHCTCLKQ